MYSQFGLESQNNEEYLRNVKKGSNLNTGERYYLFIFVHPKRMVGY